MKTIKRSFIILGLLFLSSKIYSEEIVKVYYTNWASSRYISWTEEMVRNRPSVLIKIVNPIEISVLKKMIQDDSVRLLSENQNDTSTNISIVIDIILDGKISNTYLLNQFVFYEKGCTVRYKTPKILLTKYSLLDYAEYLKYFE